MKILLCAINSKYIHSNLALHSLMAYVQEAAKEGSALLDGTVQVIIREYTINQYDREILAAIYREHPDVVMFSCYIWNIAFIKGMLPDLFQILPDVQFWLGGPEVSFDPETVMKAFPEICAIMLGEGEETFREVVEDYYGSGRKSLSEIAGLCIRDSAGIHRTRERELLSMDALPFIYQEDVLAQFDHKILYYESSRGCPFSCSYCLSSVDKRVRLRSLDQVFRELQVFLDHQVPQVKFVDRTFNVDPKRSAAILAYLAGHDNGVTNFHFEIAGDLLTEEELSIMEKMRPGLIQLEIGVQSVNPETIRAIHRVMDLAKLRQVTARIHAMGNIHQHLDLIAGLPFEDYASFAHSFDEVYSMHPAQLQLGFLKVLKGSSMREMASHYGIRYQESAPYEVLQTPWLSYGELLRLKQVEEMVELYYNSRQFTRTIQMLEGEFEGPFSLYESLARFYEQHGYTVNTPSRLQRYQILLAFAIQRVPESEELYRELLTYDLYLREHMKSRPAFARDLVPFRERIRSLGADKRLHVDVFFYNVCADKPQLIRQRSTEPCFIAFDYDARSPLDHNAAVIRL